MEGVNTCSISIQNQIHIKTNLNGGFMKGFMTLNIINFADVAKREKHRVS